MASGDAFEALPVSVMFDCWSFVVVTLVIDTVSVSSAGTELFGTAVGSTVVAVGGTHVMSGPPVFTSWSYGAHAGGVGEVLRRGEVGREVHDVGDRGGGLRVQRTGDGPVDDAADRVG